MVLLLVLGETRTTTKRLIFDAQCDTMFHVSAFSKYPKLQVIPERCIILLCMRVKLWLNVARTSSLNIRGRVTKKKVTALYLFTTPRPISNAINDVKVVLILHTRPVWKFLKCTFCLMHCSNCKAS